MSAYNEVAKVAEENEELLLTRKYAVPEFVLSQAKLLRLYADKLECGTTGFDIPELRLIADIITRKL